jgi:hypothetical protein
MTMTALLFIDVEGDVDEEEVPQPAIAPAIVPRRSARTNWYEVTAVKSGCWIGRMLTLFS